MDFVTSLYLLTPLIVRSLRQIKWIVIAFIIYQIIKKTPSKKFKSISKLLKSLMHLHKKA